MISIHSQYFIAVMRNIILNKSFLITPFVERFPFHMDHGRAGMLSKSTADRGVCMWESDEETKTERVCVSVTETKRQIDLQAL